MLRPVIRECQHRRTFSAHRYPSPFAAVTQCSRFRRWRPARLISVSDTTGVSVCFRPNEPLRWGGSAGCFTRGPAGVFVSDIFREIDEELRRDNLLKLWSRYGRHIVVLAVAVLVVAGGIVAWRDHQLSERRAQSMRYS